MIPKCRLKHIFWKLNEETLQMALAYQSSGNLNLRTEQPLNQQEC